jgi:DNA-binding NarL/FixJ family response regulator
MVNATTRHNQPISVVIVDDHDVVREGIAALLQADPHIEVVGQGGDGQEAINLTATLHPDVLLTDVRMPHVDGIQAIREIKAQWPDVRVAILTAFANDGYVLEGLIAGADGYLLKGATPAALIAGVITVAAGQQVIEPGIARHLAELSVRRSAGRSQMYDGLSQRELQLLTMLARGLSLSQIANELCIAEKTARNHLSAIYRKLAVPDRTQAILYAIKKGLIEAE